MTAAGPVLPRLHPTPSPPRWPPAAGSRSTTRPVPRPCRRTLGFLPPALSPGPSPGETLMAAPGTVTDRRAETHTIAVPGASPSWPPTRVIGRDATTSMGPSGRGRIQFQIFNTLGEAKHEADYWDVREHKGGTLAGPPSFAFQSPGGAALISGFARRREAPRPPEWPGPGLRRRRPQRQLGRVRQGGGVAAGASPAPSRTSPARNASRLSPPEPPAVQERVAVEGMKYPGSPHPHRVVRG